METPKVRRRLCNEQPLREQGDFVLYWMIAHRRGSYNFALQRAAELAHSLGRPLVILEALRFGYPHASDRLHAFILQGMAENRRFFEDRPVSYFPFVETEEHRGGGLLVELAERACAVVTDDFPAFFLPRMVEAAARKLSVMLEAVDSNGLLPLRNTDKLHARAYGFRGYVHRQIMAEELVWPRRDPLEILDAQGPAQIPEQILKSWPLAQGALLENPAAHLSKLPIDHDVEVVEETPGGIQEAQRRLDALLTDHLDEYHKRIRELTETHESGLSPYLHFGHISTHRIVEAIFEQEGWSIEQVDEGRVGKSEGFWGLSAGAEAYLDQLLTWRELGFNRCALDTDGYADYETLPGWALKTLEEHADDPRPFVYSLAEFEEATTHDELWNAAQRELVGRGTMHGYLRMLWGKKILHWSASPQEALEIMIELNNKYALDGRDPNSYSGIFWILGRFDRAWGPEREVFGKIRYMTSKSTRSKFNVTAYVERYGAS